MRLKRKNDERFEWLTFKSITLSIDEQNGAETSLQKMDSVEAIRRFTADLSCGILSAMTTKQTAIETLKSLPEDATWEDIQERINFIAGVRMGLQELNAGKGIPHKKVRKEFAQWFLD